MITMVSSPKGGYANTYAISGALMTDLFQKSIFLWIKIIHESFWTHNVWFIKNLTVPTHSYVLQWSGFYESDVTWKLHNPPLKIQHLINSCEMLTRESKIRCIHYSRIFFCVIFLFVFNCSQLQNVNIFKFSSLKRQWNKKNLREAMSTQDFLSISQDDYTNCMHSIMGLNLFWRSYASAYLELEIKPYGLGSRIQDMEAEWRLKGIIDLISWWIFGKQKLRCGMNQMLSVKVCAKIWCFWPLTNSLKPNCL